VVLAGCAPEPRDEQTGDEQVPQPIVVDDAATEEPARSEDAPTESADPPEKDLPAETPSKEPPEMQPAETPGKKTAEPPPEQATEKPADVETKPDEVPKPQPKMDQDPPPAVQEAPPAEKPSPPTPPKKPELPEHLVDRLHEPIVAMSQAHADMCRVKVGEPMPELTLPDLQGEMHTLSEYHGQTLTVVVVWSRRQALGRDQFRRLGREIWEPFREAGVNVIAINTGDAVDDVRALIEEADYEFPCLLDPDQQAMSALATGKLPRTYLLDQGGTILWLDIEYSRGSRRQLENALYFHLLGDNP
jgi:peroxiredoxin